MTYQSTRYIKTVCRSAVELFKRKPTVENYWKTLDMLQKIRMSMEADITRRGREIIDRAIRDIDELMDLRRSR